MSDRTPQYRRYRGKYARVKIDGKLIHLGEYGSDESRAKYRRLISQWAAQQPVDEVLGDEVTVAEVLEAYRAWAENHYGDVPRGRYRNLLPTIRAVRELYADLPADKFSPKKLKVVRQAFIQAGNTRTHVNTCTRRVVAIFRWAAEEEMVPGSVPHALQAVRPLEKGRCQVREGKPVKAIDLKTVNATVAELTPIVADMVRLQLASGARPGEICDLTPGEIDRSGEVWIYQPLHHKAAWKDRERVVCFGPQAQDILRKYLLRPDDQPCFSPREAMKQYLEQREAERRTPRCCGNRAKPQRRARRLDQLGDRYDVMAYRRAIHRACDRAFPPPEGLDEKARQKWKSDHRWGPNRLRHTAATKVRQEYGLDGAQAILGHAHARVTEVYSELNKEKAVEIAKRLG